jgi:hypothetical protein
MTPRPLTNAARLNYSSRAVKAHRPAAASSKLGPLPARRQHGRVELVPETIKDTAGAPAQPYRSIDVVAALLKRGDISIDEANSADRLVGAARPALIHHVLAYTCAARTQDTGQ